jgi:NADPH-dependent 7-cyano-7-deazaguanine reductase QueF-like protein
LASIILSKESENVLQSRSLRYYLISWAFPSLKQVI